VDLNHRAVLVGVSANAVCDTELDMAADIFISVNGRQVAEATLEMLIPASEGKCAPGDLSDRCKGKCGTTGKFTCKALVSNGGFDCGCSVLKIVESKPIPVKPGDYLSATLNTDRSVTPESQKRDDRLEAIIVETRVVSMVGVPATGPGRMGRCFSICRIWPTWFLENNTLSFHQLCCGVAGVKVEHTSAGAIVGNGSGRKHHLDTNSYPMGS